MTSWQIWLILAVLFVAVCLWRAWQLTIRPRLMPKGEIEALAAAFLAEHGDRAEEVAFLGEDRAWRMSDAMEQGKWRRVRGAVARNGSG